MRIVPDLNSWSLVYLDAINGLELYCSGQNWKAGITKERFTNMIPDSDSLAEDGNLCEMQSSLTQILCRSEPWWAQNQYRAAGCWLTEIWADRERENMCPFKGLWWTTDLLWGVKGECVKPARSLKEVEQRSCSLQGRKTSEPCGPSLTFV